jgi:hypothetical protein
MPTAIPLPSKYADADFLCEENWPNDSGANLLLVVLFSTLGLGLTIAGVLWFPAAAEATATALALS